MNLNKIILSGRLTKNPELKVNGETKICNFTLAVDGVKKEETDFIPCVAFGSTADVITSHCDKGSFIELIGRLHTYTKENNDGTKTYGYNVTVDNMCFVPKANTAKEESKSEPSRIVTDEELPF